MKQHLVRITLCAALVSLLGAFSPIVESHAAPTVIQLSLSNCGIKSLSCATSLAWSPDGQTIAVGGGQSLQLAHTGATSGAATVRSASVADTHVSQSITSEAWSPDGQTLAAGWTDGNVRIYTASGQLKSTLPGTAKPVTSVAWVSTSAGPFLAAGSSDGSVQVYQSDLTPLTTIAGVDANGVSTGKVIAVAWSGVETNFGPVIAISTAKEVRLQYVDGRGLSTLKSAGANAAIAMSPDGKTLATGGVNGVVTLWNLHGVSLTSLTGHTSSVTSLAWSHDNSRLAVGLGDRTVRVWSAQGKLLTTLGGFPGAVVALSWSPSGKQLATGAGDAAVRVWQV